MYPKQYRSSDGSCSRHLEIRETVLSRTEGELSLAKWANSGKVLSFRIRGSFSIIWVRQFIARVRTLAEEFFVFANKIEIKGCKYLQNGSCIVIIPAATRLSETVTS
jgi:hypothetical protein